jgi:hypothetical protein
MLVISLEKIYRREPMKTYKVWAQQTTFLYAYVEAENEDEAVEAYYRLSAEELKTKDLDGDSDWDKPWDVAEHEEL